MAKSSNGSDNLFDPSKPSWNAHENPCFDSVSVRTTYTQASTVSALSRQSSLAPSLSLSENEEQKSLTIGRVDGDSIKLSFPASASLCAEQVAFAAARKLGVEPLAAHLFALYSPGDGTYLAGVRKVHCQKSLQLRMRFLCQIDLLAETDQPAVEYLFLQCRQDFLQGRIEHFSLSASESADKEATVASARGLAGLDMLRAMKEQGLTSEQVTEGWQKKFLPRELLKSVSNGFTNKWRNYLVKNWSTKHLKDLLEERSLKYDTKSIFSLKKQYVEFLLSCAPFYMCEQFQCRLGLHPYLPTETIRLNVLETNICIQRKEDNRWRHMCILLDICDVSLNTERISCQINRLAGPPFVFAFASTAGLESFVALMDMAYRFTHRFYFNVCQGLPSPSLQVLKANRCHGPMEKDVMYAKLYGKPEGTFSICQSTDMYDTFRIDLVCKDDETRSFVIDTESSPRTLSSGPVFRLRGAQATFPSLQDLILHYSVASRDGLLLKECIRPSENEVVGLKLFPKPLHYVNSEALPGTDIPGMAVCIPPKCLVFHSTDVARQGDHGRVVRATLKQPDRRLLDVAVKELTHDLPMESTQRLLSNAQSLLQLSNPSMVVRILGIQLAPLALVTEYLPLGNLLDFIRWKRKELSLRNILEASAQVAVSLYYLEMQRVLYGPVRCKYVFVSEFHESIKVKLGPVGLSDGMHWRGLDFEGAEGKCGVWAFGTFLWEMFSFGLEPLPEISEDEAETLYRNGYRLEKPAHCPAEIYGVMERCWHAQVSQRPLLGQLQRDMNQIMSMFFHENTPICPEENGDGEPKQESKCEFLLRVTGNCLMHKMHAHHDDKETAGAPYDPWLIDESQLKVIERLGEGRYGEVNKAFYTDPLSESEPRLVAVKQLKPLKGDHLSHRLLDEMRAEMNIMKSLNHDNVVETVGIVLDPTPLLVMEFVQNGALNSYLRARQNSLPGQLLLQFSTDVAAGMAYLQSQDIVHRDLAARNILVTAELRAKIGDFGLARFLDTGGYYLTQNYGRSIPLAWYAPEVIEMHKYSSKSDTWSFGVLLWEMYSYAAAPYFCELAVLADKLREGLRLGQPAACPDAVYALMRKCWVYEAGKRPDFLALHHAFSDLLQQSS